ncbi:MAG: DUF3168 domain-containing protein [Pseudomonadota bacterium]
MSYGAAAALQAAIYQALVADPTVSSMTGGRVYDAAPPGEVPALYVALGPETVRDRGDGTGHAARHDFTVSVVAEGGGFQAAKEVAGAISDALVDTRPPLARGRVVRLDFLRATARRVGKATRRRIDLRFAALVAED